MRHVIFSLNEYVMLRYVISHPRTVVLAIVFLCLGHFKNVYDDDDYS